MTHRQARRKLGTRTHRRAGTNGKTSGSTSKSRAVKRMRPVPRSKRNAVAVAKLVKETR